MTTKTIAQRVASYTESQKAKGVVRVTVYVPKEYADQIYSLAAKLRRKQ